MLAESGEDEDLESDDSAFDEVDVSDDAPEDNMLFRNQVKDALGEAAAESSDVSCLTGDAQDKHLIRNRISFHAIDENHRIISRRYILSTDEAK